MLIFVHEREPKPNGSFTNWQIWQFLQRCSKIYPWVVKILYYLNRSWKIKMWFVYFLKTNTKRPYTAVALHLFGNDRLEEETSKTFNLFLNNCGEADQSKFQGVHMTGFPKVEEMLQLNIFLYDIEFVDGGLIGELARRSFQKIEKSVKLLRYINHICYVAPSSNLFAAAHVTQSFQRLEIWSDIWLHVASESNTFIQRMYTS